MKVFVTGAAGQLGSVLVEELVKLGYEVTAFIKPHHKTSFLEMLGVNIIKGDLKNRVDLCDKIPEESIIFHCYSLSPGANSTQETYDNENVMATINLLNEAKKKKIKQFVYMGSCSVIGPIATKDHYLSENDFTSPDESYGRSKLQAEKEIKKFYDETKIPTLILRIFPIYGPNCHVNSTPIRLCKMIKKKYFFIVGNGKNKYEFCFTRNAADGIVLASRQISSGFEIIHIAEPYKRTYQEIINALAKRLNPKLKIVHIPKPLALFVGFFGEIYCKVLKRRFIFRLRTIKGLLGGWNADCQKEISLGYQQKYTLEQGVNELVEYVENSGVLKEIWDKRYQ